MNEYVIIINENWLRKKMIVEMENVDYEIVRQKLREGSCPECGNKLQPEGGCAICICCGFSKCS